ncbi:MAG: hypothetical protein JXQ85_12415 [Cognatishimia sp.]|uniref:OmpP1/FadL family transporter n=1 Tax=Cognatishimia sp. TaxID=2211648 RepID=UPI003B8D8490
MKQAWKTRALSATAIATLAATSVAAGGVERTTQSVGILFEEGNVAELSFGSVNPTVSGVGAGAAASALQPTPGVPSGDMTDSYVRFGFSYKHQFNENLSFALIHDQPFGANVTYPLTGYYASGATAELKSNALTGVLKYTTDNNVSVFGGLRYQTLEAVASGVPTAGGAYAGVSNNDGSVGYLAGVAYERPDIALRVALTYNSAITHDWSISETVGAGPAVAGTTSVTTPQSVNLEFQSGIAQDTLVFGSIRWVDWSEMRVAPDVYSAATGGGALVAYDEDTITYNLGLGRRFNDTWSGAVSLTHEPQVGGFARNLGPTDGRTGVTLAATYKHENMEITGGVSYIWIGDADTRVSHLSPVAAGEFRDNTAIAGGVRVRFRF